VKTKIYNFETFDWVLIHRNYVLTEKLSFKRKKQKFEKPENTRFMFLSLH